MYTNNLLTLQNAFFSKYPHLKSQIIYPNTVMAFYESEIREKFKRFVSELNHKGMIVPPISNIKNCNVIPDFEVVTRKKIKDGRILDIGRLVKDTLITYGFKKVNTQSLQYKHEGVEYKFRIFNGNRYDFYKKVDKKWVVIGDYRLDSIRFNLPIKYTQWLTLTFSKNGMEHWEKYYNDMLVKPL